MAITAMLILWPGTSAFADVSGLYIRNSQAGLETFQIVETPDGQLTGRYESYAVEESGKLTSTSVGFDGLISKQQLVLHMKKSLDTLFTTQSISGEVHGNSIILTWEGGAGSFQKSETSERNEALDQLSLLSERVEWMIELDRAEQTYLEAKSAIAELEDQAQPLVRSMDNVLAQYKTLSNEHKKQEKRLAVLDAMNVHYDLQRRTETEMYRLESEFYSLEAAVEQKRSELNWEVDSAKRKLGQVAEFCEPFGQGDALGYCQELPAQLDALDSLIVDVSVEFKRWDLAQR